MPIPRQISLPLPETLRPRFHEFSFPNANGVAPSSPTLVRSLSDQRGVSVRKSRQPRRGCAHLFRDWGIAKTEAQSHSRLGVTATITPGWLESFRANRGAGGRNLVEIYRARSVGVWRRAVRRYLHAHEIWLFDPHHANTITSSWAPSGQVISGKRLLFRRFCCHAHSSMAYGMWRTS